MKNYLISFDRDKDALFCLDEPTVETIHFPALKKENIEHLDFSMLFDVEKFRSHNGRNITSEELIKTLSHIACWKAISQNDGIAEQDFVMITESQTEIIPKSLKEYLHFLKTKVISADIILLQRSDNDPYWGDQFYQQGDELCGIRFHQARSYDNAGSYCYAIRKSYCKTVLNRLTSQKPFWLSDQYSLYCDYHDMIQLNKFIAMSEVAGRQLFGKQSPLFSIIIPVYNVEAYLEQAIQSVLKQNYRRYEIILVDDGSTDNSADICYRFARKYPHIVFIKKANSGPSDTRNIAINMAKGEYILFLDSDDFWRDEHVLFDLSKIVSETNYDMILTFLSSYYAENDVVSHKLPSNDLSGVWEQDFKELVERSIYRGFIAIKVVKRKLLIDNQIYFPGSLTFEDVLWSMRLAKYITSYAFYNSDSYMYRRNRNGAITTSLTLKNIGDMLKVFHMGKAEIEEVKFSKPALYEGLKKNLYDFAGYIQKCAELFPNKEEITEEYQLFLQSFSENIRDTE